MDSQSKKLAEDIFFREPADPRIRKPKDEVKEESHPNLKVEMQTLRLNPESQKLVMDTLRFLHGPDFKLSSAGLYKDKGSNLSKRYWMERGNLVVQGGCDYSLNKKPDIASSEERLRAFALGKLERYNYHKVHCAEALEMAAENVDQAIEISFYKYFDIDSQQKPDNIPTGAELLEMRNDEKAVLESIYEHNFQVKSNNVWNVQLKLDYLTKLYQKEEVVKRKENINYNNKYNGFKTKKKEACKLFLKGPCRFGDKCRFAHEAKVEEAKTDNDNYTESISYELEIRFPEDTVYPYQVPLLCFRTVNKTNTIPELTCLKVTARLLEEAKILAQDGIPSVYSLVELLNNEEDITHFIKFDTRKFPEPSDVMFPQLVEGSCKKELPTHYKKGEARTNRDKINFDEIYKENKEIARIWLDKKGNNRYHKMMSGRKKLPAWNKRKEILNSLQKSQVVVISGETGCGKSTQVPQYILDDWLDNYKNDGPQHVDIVCTQPRRISAIGVAERVADERVEKVGQVVGYQIRLESKISSRTRLTFCTTGILLRRLEYDPQLKSVTHVIVDEVHERSLESDFLLLILRDLVKVRKDLTVILMSATLNAELFSSYFGKVPVMEIPGRTFPVEQFFLEDIMEMTNYVMEENGPYARKIKKGDKKQDIETDLETCDLRAESHEPPKVTIRDEHLTVAQMVARYPNCSKTTCKNMYIMDHEKLQDDHVSKVTAASLSPFTPFTINMDLVEHVLDYIVFGDHDWPREGAILIFLPGIAEIMSLHDQLADSPTFSPKTGKFVLIPLHSSLSGEEQALVFSKPRGGARKIVLSTNIAETSVTIEDCVFVIDCGRMKEKHFDSNRNMESLDLVWVSQANAKQRRGRAGRVMPGVCVSLYTSHAYSRLMTQPLPEIHRAPLEQLLLNIYTIALFRDMTVHSVLEKVIEPPPRTNIDGALLRLQDVGALDPSFNLTALGAHLAALPVDVRIGKLMLFGAIFRCVDSALTMAAFLSHKSPFVSPFGKKSEADIKKRNFAYANSDQLTTLRAYRKWQEALKRNNHAAIAFASENFLSHKTLLMLGEIKQQLLGLLAAIGFVPHVNSRSKKDQVATLTPPELNSNGENERLLAAILCAALYPNVVKVLTPEKSFHMQAGGAVPRQPLPEELKFKTKSDGFVALHPSSINSIVSYFASPYLVYQEKVKTSRVFIRECSMVPKLPLVLFSGCNLLIELHNGTFIVSLEDGWIMFQVDKHEVAEMLKTIRVELVNLLEEKINDPSLNLLHHEKGNRIINTIVQIITKD